MQKIMLSVIALCLLCGGAFAQQTPSQASGITPEMRAQANGFYQEEDWQNAAAMYQKIVAAEDKNVAARYRYGVALLGLNRNADALPHLEQAFNASPNPFFSLALARAYARLGEKEKTYAALEKSLTVGGIAPETLMAEKDFAALANEPRFKAVIHKSDLAVNPCKARPEFRQFDFWIGEWDAKNAQGLTVGSSSIQLILGQCIIFENWSTPVMSGKSFNIFNVTDSKWHQTWVDDKGTFTHYVGGIEDGKMVLVTENMTNGKKTLARMTFSKLPDGSVRQFGENSTDDGKTWTQTFDFIYTRKK